LDDKHPEPVRSEEFSVSELGDVLCRCGRRGHDDHRNGHPEHSAATRGLEDSRSRGETLRLRDFETSRPPVGAHCLTISTRRFCALPAGVVFGAAGLVSPKPLVVIRASAIPYCVVSAVFTAAARASESARFAAGAPTLSVWPSMRIFKSAYLV